MPPPPPPPPPAATMASAGGDNGEFERLHRSATAAAHLPLPRDSPFSRATATEEERRRRISDIHAASLVRAFAEFKEREGNLLECLPRRSPSLPLILRPSADLEDERLRRASLPLYPTEIVVEERDQNLQGISRRRYSFPPNQTTRSATADLAVARAYAASDQSREVVESRLRQPIPPLPRANLPSPTGIRGAHLPSPTIEIVTVGGASPSSSAQPTPPLPRASAGRPEEEERLPPTVTIEIMTEGGPSSASSGQAVRRRPVRSEGTGPSSRRPPVNPGGDAARSEPRQVVNVGPKPPSDPRPTADPAADLLPSSQRAFIEFLKELADKSVSGLLTLSAFCATYFLAWAEPNTGAACLALAVPRNSIQSSKEVVLKPDLPPVPSWVQILFVSLPFILYPFTVYTSGMAKVAEHNHDALGFVSALVLVEVSLAIGIGGAMTRCLLGFSDLSAGILTATLIILLVLVWGCLFDHPKFLRRCVSLLCCRTLEDDHQARHIPRPDHQPKDD